MKASSTHLLICRRERHTSAGLKIYHYRTDFAADALQAMSVAQKERTVAILLDLGLTGVDGLDRLKSTTSLRCIPVIIVTAEDPQVAEAGALRSGLSSVIR